MEKRNTYVIEDKSAPFFYKAAIACIFFITACGTAIRLAQMWFDHQQFMAGCPPLP